MKSLKELRFSQTDFTNKVALIWNNFADNFSITFNVLKIT
jgi:hypothetical protein